MQVCKDTHIVKYVQAVHSAGCATASGLVLYCREQSFKLVPIMVGAIDPTRHAAQACQAAHTVRLQQLLEHACFLAAHACFLAAGKPCMDGC